VSLAEDALKFIPEYGNPFINPDFLHSDGVFALSLAVNNLAGQVIPKNLRTANLASLQHCGVVELGLTLQAESQLTRMDLYNKILHHRINNATYVGITNFYKVRVDAGNLFEISCRKYRAGKIKVQLCFVVEKFSVVFNQGQAPMLNQIY